MNFAEQGAEVERKFLCKEDTDVRMWIAQHAVETLRIYQGYYSENGQEKRLRFSANTDTQEITVVIEQKIFKGLIDGIPVMDEPKEYIDVATGYALMQKHNMKLLKKMRYKHIIDGYNFEFDIYLNLGEDKRFLITAEVEFESLESLKNFDSSVKLPDVIVKELTGDRSFSNKELMKYVTDDEL